MEADRALPSRRARRVVERQRRIPQVKSANARGADMSRYDFEDDQPYVVIERRSEGGVGAFLLGIALGAGVALLLAPRSGEETRRDIKRRARRVRRAAENVATE